MAMNPSDEVPDTGLRGPKAPADGAEGNVLKLLPPTPSGMPPGGAHLLVSKGTTRDPADREQAGKDYEGAETLRKALVARFESLGLMKEASRLGLCGLRTLDHTKEGRTFRLTLGCGAAYCPVCVLRKRNKLFRALRGCVEANVGAEGVAALVTLALPDTPSRSVLSRLERLVAEVRSGKQCGAWRRGFKHTIGVVMGVEIGPGGAFQGHPHVHLFVFSPSTHEVQRFVGWMQIRWRRRVGRDLMDGFEIRNLSAKPDDWAPRLRYVLKGSELRPEWPEDLLCEVLIALSAGKRLSTFWGLAMRKGGWSRPRAAASSRLASVMPPFSWRLRARRGSKGSIRP